MEITISLNKCLRLVLAGQNLKMWERLKKHQLLLHTERRQLWFRHLIRIAFFRHPPLLRRPWGQTQNWLKGLYPLAVLGMAGNIPQEEMEEVVADREGLESL